MSQRSSNYRLFNRYPQHRKNFCDKCGERTISTCPECGTPIQGSYDVDGIISLTHSTPVPSHCLNCGKPFPWTIKEKTLSDTKDNSLTPNFVSLIEKICSRFHLVVKQLRIRHEDRESLFVEDEYDAQDLLHSLLRIFFDDVRSEEWTPSYAGSASRVDFLIKEHGIVIEVKKTRRTLKAKQVGDELIIDIQRYRSHPDCKKLICFVYDPEGWISNPRGLENDLNRIDDGFEVKVIITPKGY